MSKDSDILDMRLESLKNEIWEYKIYLEVCAITLFFILSTYLGTNYGLDMLSKGDILSQIILLTALILLFACVYMFIKLIYLSRARIRKIVEERKMLMQEWFK